MFKVILALFVGEGRKYERSQLVRVEDMHYGIAGKW